MLYILLTILVLIVSVMAHEIAHGQVAALCGDDTAKLSGRLSWNPLRHIDPFGSVILPLLLAIANLPILGMAKPVPVSYHLLRSPRRDSILVSIAGPLANLLLAIIAIILLVIIRFILALQLSPMELSQVIFYAVKGQVAWPHEQLPLQYLILLYLQIVAILMVSVNLLLAFFNLLPIPPLDGGRIVTSLIPQSMAKAFVRVEVFGIVIVFGLLYFGYFNLIYRWLLSPFLAFVVFGLG